jgi:4-hydroxy-tetrahydrodipicolinate reductase
MITTEGVPTPSKNSLIRVVVAGPEGQMGRVLMAGLPNQAGIKVVGGLKRGAAADGLADADVLVEFTHADSAAELMLPAIEAGVRPVSGTSGVSEEVLVAVDGAARKRGIAAGWAPHFRLAGVLMLHLARIAARYLDSAEIIEAHHATKADAPSGTAGSWPAWCATRTGRTWSTRPRPW